MGEGERTWQQEEGYGIGSDERRFIRPGGDDGSVDSGAFPPSLQAGRPAWSKEAELVVDCVQVRPCRGPCIPYIAPI